MITIYWRLVNKSGTIRRGKTLYTFPLRGEIADIISDNSDGTEFLQNLQIMQSNFAISLILGGRSFSLFYVVLACTKIQFIAAKSCKN